MTIRTPQAVLPLEESPGPRNPYRLKPGRSQSKVAVIASQRFRLQRAMIELTARDGFDAVTVRKLTKCAGVSSRSFYLRFSGIDDCLLTSYHEVMAAAVRRIAATRSAELGAADQVDRALRALLGHLLTNRDVAAFVLIEIYAGGPAAIAAIATEERRLEAALRGCLDRRSRRSPKPAVAAVVAAALRCARVQLIDASPQEATDTIDALTQWAREIIDEREEVGIPLASSQASWRMESLRGAAPSTPADRDEEDLILAAVLRLALPDGFHTLTSSKVSSAAGVPAARFRRYFANLADSYLAAIRRTCRSFFIELTSEADSDPTPRASIHAALNKASRRAASDPAAARLTFRQVLDAGIAGLTCREALISELAMACGGADPRAARPLQIRAESRVAALWAALAESAQGPRPRPGRLTG